MISEHLHFSSVTEAARDADRPIVALETIIWCQGLPYPSNLEGVRRVFDAVRAEGAVPAVLAVSDGRVLVGMPDDLLSAWCTSRHPRKVGMRDLGHALATRMDGATTVSAALAICAAAGLEVFATGGIGGVHLAMPGQAQDVSPDLEALARYSVCCVSSGAKSILDIEATLERLETLGVPVLGWETDRFPVFYARESRWPVMARVDDIKLVARNFEAGRALGSQRGLLLAVPVPPAEALPLADVDRWVEEALGETARIGKRGQALTPFLLERLHERSHGATLRANLALAENNARIAARLAVELKQARTAAG